MVKLQFTDMCEGCRCARLELLDHVSSIVGGRFWEVRCECEDACVRSFDMGRDEATENRPIRDNY